MHRSRTVTFVESEAKVGKQHCVQRKLGCLMVRKFGSCFCYTWLCASVQKYDAKVTTEHFLRMNGIFMCVCVCVCC